jgi:DNA-binding ferritin-like protein (Dps family)
MNVMQFPDRAAFLNGLFEGLDEQTAIRLFQLFAKYREVPPGERGAAVKDCIGFLKERRRKINEDNERFKKLAAQLQKARNEIRQYLSEVEPSHYASIVEAIGLFREFTACEKREIVAELIHSIEHHQNPLHSAPALRMASSPRSGAQL